MNNPVDFSGKVALVTEAASSMGLATAQAFAEACAAVVRADVKEDEDKLLAEGAASASSSTDREEDDMQITRNTTETATGPSEWFTGAVYIDTVATPTETSRLGAASVHFTPGARTAWHTHPLGQTIYVTEGLGLCQRRGGEIEMIRPGDRVFFEPGEEHWHGAAPNRFMTHIAMQEADDSGSPVAWGEHVTDEEYGAAPAIER